MFCGLACALPYFGYALRALICIPPAGGQVSSRFIEAFITKQLIRFL